MRTKSVTKIVEIKNLNILFQKHIQKMCQFFIIFISVFYKIKTVIFL